VAPYPPPNLGAARWVGPARPAHRALQIGRTAGGLGVPAWVAASLTGAVTVGHPASKDRGSGLHPTPFFRRPALAHFWAGLPNFDTSIEFTAHLAQFFL
jgi:hypothetical protein